MLHSLVVLSLAAALWLTGRILRVSWLPNAPLSPLPALLVDTTLGVVLVGWLAITLAELNQYALPTVGLLWICTLIGTLIWRSWRQTDAPPSALWPTLRMPRPQTLLPRLLLGGWLLLAVVVYFRPHQLLLGGSDAGVYVNLGAHIANSGRIAYQDPILEQLDPTLAPIFLRELPPYEVAPYYLFPGFNAQSTPPGRVEPQFYHYYPTWLALAYDLGGVQTALRLNGLWAILGSLAIAAVVRDLLAKRLPYTRFTPRWVWPLLALALLLVNALQAWFGRYPTAEMLSQYLLWCGLWSLGRWLTQRPHAAIWGLTAGLTFGTVMFVRIDTLFLLAIPLLLATAHLIGRIIKLPTTKPIKHTLWFHIPFALLSTQALWHANTLSQNYFNSTFASYKNVLLYNAPRILTAGVLAIALLAGTLWLYRHKIQQLAQYKPRLSALLSVAFATAIIYLWVIRPLLGGPTYAYTHWYGGHPIPRYEHENFVRFGWYMSSAGLLLGSAGISWLIWRVNRYTAALLALPLMYMALYMWRISANPLQIYAMRRYVPTTLPLFIIGGTVLLGFIATTVQRTPPPHRRHRYGRTGLALLLAMVWLASSGLAVRGFLSQVDYAKFPGQIAEINAQLAPNSVLLFRDDTIVSKGDMLGTTLQYQYGHHALTVRAPSAAPPEILRAAIAQWQEAGHTVYWFNDRSWLDEQGVDYTPMGTAVLDDMYLEQVYTHKPAALRRFKWHMEFVRLSAVTD